MTLPEECINATTTTCIECETELSIKVLKSAAGYYIGFFCPNFGPYSRERGFYGIFGEAESGRGGGSWGRR